MDCDSLHCIGHNAGWGILQNGTFEQLATKSTMLQHPDFPCILDSNCLCPHSFSYANIVSVLWRECSTFPSPNTFHIYRETPRKTNIFSRMSFKSTILWHITFQFFLNLRFKTKQYLLEVYCLLSLKTTSTAFPFIVQWTK